VTVTLKKVMKSLPPARRRRIDRRYRELLDEVKSLKGLRRVLEKSQADMAAALRVSQPAISKMERQTDMYLSTLRAYVEAAGGELDVIVRLPQKAPIRLASLKDVSS
jgi:DNA-binding XRE family transcriptional regulator